MQDERCAAGQLARLPPALKPPGGRFWLSTEHAALGSSVSCLTKAHVQACVPAADTRMALACETSGVELARLPPPLEPTGGRFQLPELTGQAATAVILGVPALLLGAAYIATQIGAHLRVRPALRQ